MKRFLLMIAAVFAGWAPLHSQTATIRVTGEGQIPRVAAPDLRGSGDAAPLMDGFNARLQTTLKDSGQFDMVSKSFMPAVIPQTPQEFKPPVGGRKAGPWLTDWSEPPASANFLAFGYTAVQNGRLVLFGWFHDVTKPDVASAQLLGKLYFGPVNADGAKSVADQFAADILALFGAKSLAGTKIWYVSRRGGNKEIFSMDYDGQNQKQFSFYNSLCTTPALSPDNSKIAFTDLSSKGPIVRVHSTDSGRRLPFLNPVASTNSSPEFTADGRILFSSTLAGGFANLYIAREDGSGVDRLTSVRAVEVEPKVNPKNGRDVVFVSGRAGSNPQIWMMSIDGTDARMVTPGDGEAVNPAWSPDGTKLAFSWTRGFAPGTYNIFVMDVASKKLVQLTQGSGKNENPTWSPTGTHLAFASTRAGGSQIFTMRADGQDVKQVTFSGWNEKPVWSKK
jgi:TolB protein